MKDIVKEARLCTGCSACSQVCPKSAITMTANEEGFLYPSIDEDLCSSCGLCGRICPVNTAIRNADGAGAKTDAKDVKKSAEAGEKAISHKVYACYSRDESVRSRSSSGGVFTQLALSILADGGVVFGAGFDGNYNVIHTYAENEKQLDNLRRSKYVQSDIANSFIEAGDFLKAGRKVLFCGTPCQIAGLKAFLTRDYTGLLLSCDLACHGVPSPKVWEMFLKYLRDIYKSDIKAVSFRDKSTGWNDSSMNVEFKNGSRYIDRVKREIYFMGFGKSIFNRKSCYDCKFRIDNTKADITLADFWGIDRHGEQEYSDNKGVSLILTHTEAGEEALKRIGENVCIRERSLNEAVRFNPRLVSSVAEPAGRKLFFDDLKSGYDFDRLRAKYMDNKSLKYMAKRLAKRLLGRG